MRLGLGRVWVLALAACGRVGFDADLPPEGNCEWGEAQYLQPPEPLEAINSGARESAPFITAGGETLYFASDESGTSDFYTAQGEGSGPTRFADPERYDDLSSEAEDTALTLSADRLEVYFASDRAGSDFDLFRGSRPAEAAPFIDDEPLDPLNSAEDELSPHLAESDLALYFTRRSEGGSSDLYVSRRASGEGDFGEAALVEELSSADDEHSPSLTEDGRVIVFSSARGGNRDLYYATRPSTDEAFGEPAALDEVNTAGIERDPFVSEEDCYVYFASDRDGGDLDLYVARAFR